MEAAGKLSRRITLQSPTYSKSSTSGERVASWTTSAVVWANLSSVNGREFEMAKTFGATVSGKAVIRWRAGVTNQWRFTLGNRIMTIVAVIDEKESKQDLTLYYTEVL